MKKRLFTELSDETEPVIKRTRLILSSPAHAFDEDELFLSLNSEIKYDDDDIIEITHEHMNSPCQQIDNTIIINSDDDDDDDETTDIPSTMASIVDTFISSPLSDDVQAIEVEEEINIQNDVEIIDLTEDEPTSPCCSFNQLERTSSIDAEECPICLESLSDLQYTGVHLMITQCHHVMCVLCCGQLLANSSRCPLCRENMALAAIQALYDDDDDDVDVIRTRNHEEETEDQMAVMNDPTFSVMSKIKLNLTPAIAIQPADTSSFLDIKTREVSYNPTYEDMYAPVFGPTNPNMTQQQRSFRNVLNGYAESTTLSDFQFENQRRTFDSFGYAADPSVGEHATPQIVGDQDQAELKQGMTIFETTKNRSGEKRKKEKNTDSADVEGFQGPWAPYFEEITVSRPSEEEKKEIDEYLANKKKTKRPTIAERNAQVPARDPESTTLNKEPEDSSSTTLHIKDPYDYQGRSFLHIPQDVGVNLRSEHPPQRCFIPKQCIHIYKGHTKAVQKVHYFPVSAHLFLTCSMDCKVKLWEFYNERRCIRTYSGHSQAVRDVSFNATGTEFLSASYDKTVKLWDTETGLVKSKFSMRKIPYCIAFNPSEHKQHLFICGMSDKKILCFDIRSGHVVQEYDRHLGAINTVTFVDRNRRIVSTSDDKSLRVWEWNIPVDFKYIAEPTMHSLPAVAQSRNGRYLAFQSMDNQIRIMEPLANFRWKAKKVFKGHMVSGYACGLDFSPDMSYVISGDADGHLMIWDWKTTRLFEQIKAHDDVCSDAKWHWHEKSRVLTAGWDNVVKLWD